MHKFVCRIISANCRKLLDSGSITEHGGEMFCGSCYRKNFGPKGYGFGGLNMDDGKGYQVCWYNFYEKNCLKLKILQSIRAYIDSKQSI